MGGASVQIRSFLVPVLGLLALLGLVGHAAAQSGTLALDTKWHAMNNNFSISLPSDWTRDVSDEIGNANAAFTAPDGNLVVGVSAFAPGEGWTFEALIAEAERQMFQGAETVREQEVTLSELGGIMRRYDMTTQDGPMMTVAVYLDAQSQAFVLWAVAPMAMAQTRMQEAEQIMNSFVFNGAPPPEDVLTPPVLAGLALSDGPRTAAAFPDSAFRLPLDADRLFADLLLIGAGGPGHVGFDLVAVETGETLWTGTQAADATAELTLRQTLPRPEAGWRRGLYQLSVTWNGTLLGSRMFLMEATP